MNTVRQLSVFLENRSGRLAEVFNKLAEEQINVRAMCVADTSEFGILRLIVPDTKRSAAVLRDAGFAVGESQVFAAEVPDKPGGMAGVLKVLAEDAINVEYAYAYGPVEGTGKAVILFRVPDEILEMTAKAFANANIRTLSEQELMSL